MVARERLTAQEFDHIAGLPENQKKRLEFIGVEIVEEVSNNYSSEVAAEILGELRVYVKAHKLLRQPIAGAPGCRLSHPDCLVPDTP